MITPRRWYLRVRNKTQHGRTRSLFQTWQNKITISKQTTTIINTITINKPVTMGIYINTHHDGDTCRLFISNTPPSSNTSPTSIVLLHTLDPPLTPKTLIAWAVSFCTMHHRCAWGVRRSYGFYCLVSLGILTPRCVQTHTPAVMHTHTPAVHMDIASITIRKPQNRRLECCNTRWFRDSCTDMFPV